MLVIKRHDEQTTFNTNKIFNAIKKAFEGKQLQPILV